MLLPDSAIGSIIAAAIAGVVVFISTMLSKEQKTSEFRQAWIDELRNDVSKYISGSTEVIALYYAKNNNKQNQEKFLDDNFQLIHDLQTLEHRIILRLNQDEHQELISKIKKFREVLSDIYKNEKINTNRKEAEFALIEDLLFETKKILKYEWKRVKKGEIAFRITKIASLIIIILGCVYFLFNLKDQFTGAPSSISASVKEDEPSVTVNNYTKCVYCSFGGGPQR